MAVPEVRKRSETPPALTSADAKDPAVEAAKVEAAKNATPQPTQKADNIKIEDERSMAMAGSSLTFSGVVLTAEDGPLKIPEEARNLCALFDTGLWLVSASHRRSPLVTSVASAAKRQGYQVDEPRYVTPNIINQAYLYADRKNVGSLFDENAVRRKIVDTLQKAVEANANDIHIEAVNHRTRVEFRIDGALRVWETWTQREGEQFLAAVYSHSIGQSGSTANWSEPQAAMLTSDAKGRDAIALPKGIISVRCQWVPLSNEGRYLDMRLQYDSAALFGENFVMADVDSLGFSQEQLKVIQSLRALPGGMRIFSGPVNQGKTTTLRVTLNRRMSETNMQLNCLMIEDPPEGGIIGARQIGVSASVKDEQREKTFVEIMRCALRLDPDIVMLGEIRDMQTAKFAFRLALTGRQVYTTGHVYSALATPMRLRDIGIEPYMVYDHHLVRGMICQRLLRGMCSHCRIYANPEGCPKCYKGRAGRTICAEVIETDAKIMELLADNRMEEARLYWLSPVGLNGITMLWHGLEKVRRGEVSPNDGEFELGPFASERELAEVEQRLGAMP